MKCIIISYCIIIFLSITACAYNSDDTNVMSQPTIDYKYIPYTEEQVLEYLKTNKDLDPIEGIWSASSFMQMKFENKNDMTQNYNKVTSSSGDSFYIITKENLTNNDSFIMFFYKPGKKMNNEVFGQYTGNMVRDIANPNKYYSNSEITLDGRISSMSFEYLLNGNKIITSNISDAVLIENVAHLYIRIDYIYDRVEIGN